MKWKKREPELIKWGNKVKLGIVSWRSVADNFNCSVESARSAYRYIAIKRQRERDRLKAEERRLRSEYKYALRHRVWENAIDEHYHEHCCRDLVAPPDFGVVAEIAGRG